MGFILGKLAIKPFTVNRQKFTVKKVHESPKQQMLNT